MTLRTHQRENIDLIELETRLRDLYRAIKIAAHLSNEDVDDDGQVCYAIDRAKDEAKATLACFYSDPEWGSAA